MSKLFKISKCSFWQRIFSDTLIAAMSLQDYYKILMNIISNSILIQKLDEIPLDEL
jgi:hypothetical protein